MHVNTPPRRCRPSVLRSADQRARPGYWLQERSFNGLPVFGGRGREERSVDIEPLRAVGLEPVKPRDMHVDRSHFTCCQRLDSSHHVGIRHHSPTNNARNRPRAANRAYTGSKAIDRKVIRFEPILDVHDGNMSAFDISCQDIFCPFRKFPFMAGFDMVST